MMSFDNSNRENYQRKYVSKFILYQMSKPNIKGLEIRV